MEALLNLEQDKDDSDNKFDSYKEEINKNR